MYEKQRMGESDKQNQAPLFHEKDSAPPSCKRSEQNLERINELFVPEEALENDRETQSCVFLDLNGEVPDNCDDSRYQSLSQRASQSRETGVEDVTQEGDTFFGLKSGHMERNCPVKESLTLNHKQASSESTHQKPGSSDQECLCLGGMADQCFNKNNVEGSLEESCVQDSLKNETISTSVFAAQRNSLKYIPVAHMPSIGADSGIQSFETFVKLSKNESENEEIRFRLKADTKEDADILHTETQVQVTGCNSDDSFAGDVGQCADDNSLENGIKSSKNSKNNDGENSAYVELEFPDGAGQGCTFCLAAAQTSLACSEHMSGKGVVSVSHDPTNVIDVAAVIESRICCKDDRTRVEHMKRELLRSCLPSVGAQPDTATEGTCLDGPVQFQPHEQDSGVFQIECHVKTVHEKACEEWSSKDNDKIQESIRSLPSHEAIPAINSRQKLDASPVTATNACTDGEYMPSQLGETTMELAGSQREFTCETGTEKGEIDFGVNIHQKPELTGQHYCAREELDNHSYKGLQQEEYHCSNTFCTNTYVNCRAENKTQVLNSAIEDSRCEVNDMDSPTISNTAQHIRTIDTTDLVCENMGYTLAGERDNSSSVLKSPVGSAIPESEFEESGNTVAAGWGCTAIKKDICKGEQGPTLSQSLQSMLTCGLVTENISANSLSNAMEVPVEKRCLAAPAKQPGDAVVPEPETGCGTEALQECQETKTQTPVHCCCNCSPNRFDSFEKIPLSLSAEGLERSPLVNISPHSLIKATALPYHDINDPFQKKIPLQALHPPNSSLNMKNKQLSEGEGNIKHCASQGGSELECGSHLLRFDQGGSRGESESNYFCDLEGEKQIPYVYFAKCSPADSVQVDHLPAAFSSNAKFDHLPQAKPDASDEKERLVIFPQAFDLRSQTTISISDSAQKDDTPHFEMKGKFDLVLEELSLISSIGEEDEQLPCSEAPYIREGPLGHGTAERDVGRLSSPALKTQARAKLEQNFHRNIRAVRQQPETTSSKVGFDYEQEVPLGLSHSTGEGEDSMYSFSRPKEHVVAEDGSKQWSPAFMVLPFQNDQNRGSCINMDSCLTSCRIMRPSVMTSFLCEGDLGSARRLGPLKTCVRPIRIGLSKRERPKQLHPYFK